MSNNVTPATVSPCKDKGVLAIIDKVMIHHGSLAKAKIRVFWDLNKSIKHWGSVALPSEVVYCLTGVDIILRLNQTLWQGLTDDARTGLIDHFLSQLRAKEDGKSIATTSRGNRQLFARATPTLSIHPAVLARNPTLFAEIDELKNLSEAMTDGKQYLLFEAQRAEAAAEAQEQKEAN